MTFTCKCGAILSAPPDPILDDQRQARMLHNLTERIGQHIQAEHAELASQAFMRGLEFTGYLTMREMLQQCDPALTALFDETRQRLAALLTPTPPASANPPGGGKLGLA